ncbi:VWA domain-containing protein, partial [Rhodovulum sulfidophilum]|nr:VWA domain-containing protein [Rhodovulum sulfidophilum]
MFLPFFQTLRTCGIPVSLREYLSFLDGMKAGLVTYDPEGFYYLARTALVKDERQLDRFDRAFAESFGGLEQIDPGEVLEALELPEDWLRKLAEGHLSPEERAEIEAMGGFDKLMEALKERLKEQKERHQGGNKWIGTAGTSPFGAYGYNPD